MIKFKYPLLTACLGAALLLSGCGVTHQQLKQVRQIAEEAQSTANDASYQANQAKLMADEALTGVNQIKKKLGIRGMMK